MERTAGEEISPERLLNWATLPAEWLGMAPVTLSDEAATNVQSPDDSAIAINSTITERMWILIAADGLLYRCGR
jgi:hypothetical protein